MNNPPGTVLLLAHLQAAVRVEIEAARSADAELRVSQGRSLLPVIMEHGDDLMFGGRHCQEAAAALARVLAVLAFQPGGVRFGTLGFCAAHIRQRWPEGDVICPACLGEERAAREAACTGGAL